jgi:transcriptional regulatory protein RtcR
LRGALLPHHFTLTSPGQLAYVLDVCRRSTSLSEAGRTLFAVSRERKKSVNDADRVRKYLLRFGLEWSEVRAGAEANDSPDQ